METSQSGNPGHYNTLTVSVCKQIWQQGPQCRQQHSVRPKWHPIPYTVGKKVFSKPPIVQVLPLKDERPVIFIIGTLQL